VGLVFNLRFVEVFDFLGGLFCLDLCTDDGTGDSRWPWQAKGASNECYRPELPY
jgi:hypothetical protein